MVFLEHGYHSGNAASVAHHALDTFFAKRDGRPLPPPPTREDLRLDLSDPMDSRVPVPSRPTQEATRVQPAEAVTARAD